MTMTGTTKVAICDPRVWAR